MTRVEEGHELLARYPHLFEPASENLHFRVARQEPVIELKRAQRGRRGKQAARATDVQPVEAPSAPEGATADDSTPEGATADDSTPEGVTADDAGGTAAVDDATTAPEEQ